VIATDHELSVGVSYRDPVRNRLHFNSYYAREKQEVLLPHRPTYCATRDVNRSLAHITVGTSCTTNPHYPQQVEVMELAGYSVDRSVVNSVTTRQPL